MPSTGCELHSASTSSPLNSSNISNQNVNRFYTQSTTNFASVTPVSASACSRACASTRCDSSHTSTTSTPNGLASHVQNTNSSLTLLTNTISSTTTSSPFLDIPNTSSADIAIAAKAAYDLAGLTASFHHRSPAHCNHQLSHSGVVPNSVATSGSSPFATTYLNDCGVVDTFANGLTGWEVAAHQSAAAFAAASHHHYPHPLSNFSPHCDIRTAFALSVPPSTSTSSNCVASVTSGSVPAMTVQRVSDSIRGNSAAITSASASLSHQNANALANGLSPNFTITGNVSGGHKSSKPRRRVATIAQRRAANIRERRRMFNLNSAFDKLRKKVPTFAYEKRLSRIETLRLAIMYIGFMTEVVSGKDPCFEPRIPLHPSGSFQNHRTNRDHLWNGSHYPFNAFSDTFKSTRF